MANKQLSTHAVKVDGKELALEPLTAVMGPAMGAMCYTDDDALLDAAAKKATALRQVVDSQKLSVSIKGREHVKCEGWVTLAALTGLIPTIVGTEGHEDGHYCAVAELRTHAGTTLSRADAECGTPDDGGYTRTGEWWSWNERPHYARRSMAQTRAVGKVCRISLSWIMVLAGYAPTPAEEMDGVREEVEKESGPDRRMVDCIQALRINAASIAAIDEGFRDHSGDGLREAATAWFELSKEAKEALWIAPTKGGPWTTQEREILKSGEFRRLYYGEDEDKKEAGV